MISLSLYRHIYIYIYRERERERQRCTCMICVMLCFSCNMARLCHAGGHGRQPRRRQRHGPGGGPRWDPALAVGEDPALREALEHDAHQLQAHQEVVLQRLRVAGEVVAQLASSSAELFAVRRRWAAVRRRRRPAAVGGRRGRRHGRAILLERAVVAGRASRVRGWRLRVREVCSQLSQLGILRQTHLVGPGHLVGHRGLRVARRGRGAARERRHDLPRVEVADAPALAGGGAAAGRGPLRET